MTWAGWWMRWAVGTETAVRWFSSFQALSFGRLFPQSCGGSTVWLLLTNIYNLLRRYNDNPYTLIADTHCVGLGHLWW